MRLRALRRPTHGTIAAYLAIFLVLAGGAIAAATINSADVVNGSLKSVDLRNGQGVKGSDVKNSTLAGGDIRNGSLRGGNAADNSLGGADVNESSLKLTQKVAQLGSNLGFAMPTPLVLPFPNNTYTQAADQSNIWIGGGQVTFSAACQQPRSALIYLFADSSVPSVENVAGVAQVADSGAGAVSRRFNFAQFPGSPRGMIQTRTGAAVPHTFYL